MEILKIKIIRVNILSEGVISTIDTDKERIKSMQKKEKNTEPTNKQFSKYTGINGLNTHYKAIRMDQISKTQ